MRDYPYVPGWRLNKENNKPVVKHSVLMLTRHGVAEGEWNGNEWVQYRWSCKVKDSDVLYWIHLEDLIQLEKEGQTLQQEPPEIDGNDGKFVKILVRKELAELFQKLGDEIQAGQSSFIRAMNQQEQPEVDLDEHYIADTIQNLFPTDQFIESESLLLDRDEAILFARHFYELGLNARKQ